MEVAVMVYLSHKHLIFLFLLILSVGTKLILSIATPTADEQTAAKAAISNFLGYHGFSIDSGGDRPDSPFVSASNGQCRLVVAAVAPQGWNRDAIRQQSEPND